MSKNIGSYTFHWNNEAWGYTNPSLRRLRNSLCSFFCDYVCVVEVETLDGLCGFLILNSTENVAVFTGDGFRTDGGGEGGAGYNTAQALFAILGIPVSISISIADKIKKLSIGDQLANYVVLAQSMIIDELLVLEADLDFVDYSQMSPGYIRKKIY